MIQHRDALLRLLQDDDPSTLALVKQQLAQNGIAGLDDLRALLVSANPLSTAHLLEVIHETERREADAIFSQVCASFEEHGDLEHAAWRLAATFLPDADFRPAQRLLDRWGAEVTRRLGKAATSRDRIETLVEFLAHELRFHGNADDYYNINNSLLPEVVETRVGLPITLSLVYILVAKRAGLTVHGVGLPGHFIIRHGEDFFDPFGEGRRIGLEECRWLVAHHGISLSAHHLLPISPKQMLVRMLGNIHSAAEASDPPLAEKVAGWIARLRSQRETSKA